MLPSSKRLPTQKEKKDTLNIEVRKSKGNVW